MSADAVAPDEFESVCVSRRNWINEVLRPWCQRVSLIELRKAEQEWFNLAGRVDIDATLWTWAWERFPAIVHPDLPGVNETYEVTVVLHNGDIVTGFPDNRASRRGQLTLVAVQDDGNTVNSALIAVDQIQLIRRTDPSSE